MIARPWRGEAPRSALDRALAWPLAATSHAYALGARLHRASYARGLREPRRLASRVLSVGSLWVGGTAKTPLAAWVAARLHERGHKVALASRGYGRRSDEPVTVVSDGTHVRADGPSAGDEAWILTAHAPGVPVLVGRDRAVVGWHAEITFGTELLVLDDGFQHHRLARDVDLVTVDAGAPMADALVLPAGTLREAPRALAKAHALAIIDGPPADRDEQWLARHTAGIRRFSVSRRMRGWRGLEGGALEPVSALRGIRAGLISGLGRPEGFRRSVEALGVEVVAERRHPDHHRYRARDLKRLGEDAEVWLTSEKDAGKILPRWCDGLDLRVLSLGVVVEDEVALLEWLEARLRA